MIVDSYGAQHAGGPAKKMGVVFAVTGLYLYLEKGYTGKDVRQAHADMAQHKGYNWPALLSPDPKYRMTISDVITATDKDKAIHEWAVSTWAAWQKDRALIITICNEVL